MSIEYVKSLLYLKSPVVAALYGLLEFIPAIHIPAIQSQSRWPIGIGVHLSTHLM